MHITDESVTEALCNMLVGQCALVHYCPSDNRAETITATSIQLAGEGCQTILSYPPFSSAKPATSCLDISSSIPVAIATGTKDVSQSSSSIHRVLFQSPCKVNQSGGATPVASDTSEMPFSQPNQASTPRSAMQLHATVDKLETTPLLQSPSLGGTRYSGHKCISHFCLGSNSGATLNLFSECDSPELLPLKDTSTCDLRPLTCTPDVNSSHSQTTPASTRNLSTQTFTPEIL